jgi:sphingomyelin phosphodiesterase
LKFDIVYWTGDLPPHNIWDQSRSDQLLALKSLTTLFKAYFPDKSIFPSLGNHETTPVNLYPPPSVKEDNITWLYEELTQSWTQTGLPTSLIPDIIKFENKVYFLFYLTKKLNIILQF